MWTASDEHTAAHRDSHRDGSASNRHAVAVSNADRHTDRPSDGIRYVDALGDADRSAHGNADMDAD
jgi:hypothetical protein